MLLDKKGPWTKMSAVVRYNSDQFMYYVCPISTEGFREICLIYAGLDVL